VATGDFNNDGVLDLATANEEPGTVSVLLNRTPQVVLDTVSKTIDGAAETNYSLTVDLTTGSIRVNSTPAVTRTFTGYQNVIGTQKNDALAGNSIANRLSGGSGNDRLTGNGGNDTLTGDRGNDKLNGGAGDDDLLGGVGNDTYLFDADSALGDDLITDAFGGNKLDFSSTTTQAVALNLAETDTQLVNANLSLTLGRSVIRDAIGGSKNDRLVGNDLANTLNGGNGNDTLTGGNGNDTLVGGAGKDLLSGGAGTDKFTFTALNQSLLASYDVITNYAAGEQIDAPSKVIDATLTASSGTAASLTAAAISAVLTSGVFTANSAKAFTVTGQTGTFLAFNDGTAGFNGATDAIVHLQNYALGSVTVV
jgi:Ca2+-binding RTX toxin-like protein